MEKTPPPDAYKPGTVLTVGSHTAVVQQYISEGGFAHVYRVEISPIENDTSVACLKRVLVPDKVSLNNLRAEVDSMKRLTGYRHIVSYIDSHAARNSAGGYEVFVIMELCARKGLIDFMNTRLQTRLTEAEVLKIMAEITEGVANMHALTPPLVHRDIKIENVLIAENGDYKLCDFGSASPVLRPPRNSDEFAILQNDVLKNTTPQYRSPEMIDLYRGLPIDEKSDVWALGIFLYKICYYTTPFEAKGELAILHASFEFPSRPVYSDRLKNLISVLLREDPRRRPNVYQILEEVCRMRNFPVPIADFTKKKSLHHQTPIANLQQSNSPHYTSQSAPFQATAPQKVPTQVNPVVKSYSTIPKKPLTQPPANMNNLNGLKPVKSFNGTSDISHAKNFDPFHNNNKIEQSKFDTIDYRPPKPPRPSNTSQIASNIKDLNKSLGSLSLNNNNGQFTPSKNNLTHSSKSATNLKPRYVDSVVQTDGDDDFISTTGLVKSRQQTSRSSNAKPANPRPKSMYSLPSQSRSFSSDAQNSGHSGTEVNELKRIITGLSSQTNTIEFSPGESHIDSSIEFLKNLEQQDSGKSWVQQTTGGSIKSLRRISTGSKKRNSLISQFTGKFSRSQSRNGSRASSIHESAGIYSNNTGSSAKYRSSSESIQEEIGTPPKELEKKNSLSRTASIQRRVQALLNKSNEQPVTKTAKGYGNDESDQLKATKAHHNNQIDSDGFLKPKQIKSSVPPSLPKRKPVSVTPPLSAQSTTSTLTRTPKTSSSHTQDSPSTIKKTAPPPKPKKPDYLKTAKPPVVPQHGIEKHKLERTISIESDISFTNVDALEKNFQKRFPKAL